MLQLQPLGWTGIDPEWQEGLGLAAEPVCGQWPWTGQAFLTLLGRPPAGRWHLLLCNAPGNDGGNGTGQFGSSLLAKHNCRGHQMMLVHDTSEQNVRFFSNAADSIRHWSSCVVSFAGSLLVCRADPHLLLATERHGIPHRF